jgi:hypothetical protein
MNRLFAIALLLLFISGCVTSQNPDHVGDIIFDARLDKSDFDLCGSSTIHQYFNNHGGFEYIGEKRAIETRFMDTYHAPVIAGQSGMIRIRFVVNCKGQTDRFRLLMSDPDYQPFLFDTQITDQLLGITRSLTGWKPKQIDEQPINYSSLS